MDKPNFHNRKRIRSKLEPRYPMSAEREYRRAMERCMKQLESALLKERPALIRAVEADRKAGTDSAVHREMKRLEKILIAVLLASGLEKDAWKIARMARGWSRREWLRIVDRTLGLRLNPKSYPDSFYEKPLTEWVEASMEHAKQMVHLTSERMEKRMEKAGKLTPAQEIVLGGLALFAASRAASFARNETGNLSCTLQRLHQEDAGVKRYVWSTCNDERVRASHRRLEGKTFDWDDPPDVGGGRHCHPGEDYNCRCVAVPVFESEHVHFPDRAKRR